MVPVIAEMSGGTFYLIAVAFGLAVAGIIAVNFKVAEMFVEAFGNIIKQGNTMILPGNAADIAAMVATAMQVVKKS